MYRLLLLCLLLVWLCGCRETVVHNLSEPDANRMLAHLYDHKLEAKKVKQPDGRWSLSLPNDQVASAIKTLDANKLLKNEATDFSQQSGFMSSQEQERFRFERALSKEIESTLASLPTVLQARVHLNLPIVDPILGLKENQAVGSASVMLLSNSEYTNRDEVIALVAGASGVKANNISVVISVSKEKQPYELSAKGENLPENNFKSEQELSNAADFSSSIMKYLMPIISVFKAALTSLPFLIVLSCSIVFILVLRRLNHRPKLII